MRLFKKKGKIIDLSDTTKNYTYLRKEEKNKKEEDEKNPLGFLSNLASSSSQTLDLTIGNTSDAVEEKRKRLTKRLLDITEKLETLSNSVYHLEQRMEVLEKKLRIDDFY